MVYKLHEAWQSNAVWLCSSHAIPAEVLLETCKLSLAAFDSAPSHMPAKGMLMLLVDVL